MAETKCPTSPSAPSDAAEGSSWPCEDFHLTNLRMLENESLTDVVIQAGETKTEIKAHKFMLASRSPVFHTMFCGSLPETSGVITVQDIEPDIMKVLLRFLYTGSADIVPENVMALLYAAKKYGVLSLEVKCRQFLVENLNVDNVVIILEHAEKFGEEDLVKICTDFAIKNAEGMFESEDFVSISKDALEKIVENDALTCKNEVSVYKACKNWSVKRCQEKSLDVSNDVNLRNELGSITRKIRFPSMTIQQFTEFVSYDDILTEKERLQIYQDIVLGKQVSGFKSKRRSSFCGLLTCLSSEPGGTGTRKIVKAHRHKVAWNLSPIH